MAQRPTLEFWYDFASTYSYLTAMRIEAATEMAGVDVLFRPFLLGPIFAAQGWTSSPFNLFPGRGRYMWRDMEREAARLRIPFYRPNPFPQNSLLAARVALVGSDRGWTPAFTRIAFTEEFGNGRDIAEREVIADILSGLGLDATAVLADAEADTNKLRLRRIGEEAQARGVFGAPTLIAEDGEMFWGNDRLERALEWAVDDRARRADFPV
ncbi:2-hydroxychromene-2-carboxylate isomerase [Microvirga antarctica]|uniref:2-hydroxychromene-2-carboxylate isomerase n=1 Tax=Microvirga antarctica TaxID=2819233 RepID=UPI001B30640F|nr:2-hydroxychromene-2-carboxylate isomerase [Microvirga antarctica]